MTVKTNPMYLYLGQIDAEFCQREAELIEATTIPNRSGNNDGTGKFSEDYQVRYFHRDSKFPLIERFVSHIESKRDLFTQTYPGKLFKLDFAHFTVVEDDSRTVCKPHRDGVIWDGTFHLTIHGHSNIRIFDNSISVLIRAEPGTLWYLNTRDYQHTIEPGDGGKRVEVLLPNNLHPNIVFGREQSLVWGESDQQVHDEHPATKSVYDFGVKHFQDEAQSSKSVSDKRNILVCNPSISHGEQYLPYLWGSLRMYAEHVYENRENLVSRYNWLDPIFGHDTAEKLFEPYIGTRIDVLALSCYMWNWETNMEIAQLVRQHNPGVKIILGGPHMDWSDSNILQKYPQADLIVMNAGERTFAELLHRFYFEPNNSPHHIGPLSVTNLRNIPNLISWEFRTKPDTVKLDMSEWPSPFRLYSDDYFRFANSIRDQGAVVCVGWETNRGCPYSCTFCDWGSATNSKISRYSDSRILTDIDEFGRIEVDFVFNTDANFGIFHEDLYYANSIIETKRKYGYPRTFNFNAAKNNKRTVSRINSELYRNGMIEMNQIGFQHTDSEVLAAINRSNIPVSKMLEEIQQNHLDGVPFVGVLISGNPGDTVKKWKTAICDLLEWGFHESIKVHDFALLPNSPAAHPDYMGKWEIETVRRRFPEVRPGKNRPSPNLNKTDFIVSTKTFTKQDWVEMKVWSEVVQGLHNMGPTRFIAQFLHDYHGVSYREFYERVLNDYRLGGIVQTLRDTFERYLVDEDAELYLDLGPDYTVLAAPHEYVYMNVIEYIHEFGNTLRDTINDLTDCDYTPSLVKFQKDILLTPDYDPAVGKRIETQHNWPEIFANMLTRSPLPDVNGWPKPNIPIRNGFNRIEVNTTAVGINSTRRLKKFSNLNEFFRIVGVANFRHRTTYFYVAIVNHHPQVSD